MGCQEPDGLIEWPYVDSGPLYTKYSEAEEITAANVGEFEIVWQWEPKEIPFEEYGTWDGPFQVTPVTIGNVLNRVCDPLDLASDRNSTRVMRRVFDC